MNKVRAMFTGTGEIFKFTLRQLSMGKGFKIATFGVSILLFLLLLGINVGVALFTQEEEKQTQIQTLLIYNETELTVFDNMDFLKDTQFKEINVETTEGIQKELREDQALLHFSGSSQGYTIELTISDQGLITKDDADALLDELESQLTQFKYLNSGIPADKLSIILSPVSTAVTEVGDEGMSLGEILIKMVLPMVLSFLLYFMLLYYGQSLGKIIVAERSSKLTELLLVSVKPYAVVSGKILAASLVALIQILSWIFCAIAGFAVGDKVAGAVSSTYHNVVLDVIELIKNNTDKTAFSLTVIILAILALCLGFFFYSVLAGLIFSNITKVEELSNGTSVFTLFIIAGFFSSYFLTAFSEGSSQVVLTVLRYVPVVSPFILPADILVGNISIMGGIISLLITVCCTLVLVYFTGKQYKKKLFG